MYLFKQKMKPEEHVLTQLLKFFNIQVPRCHGSMMIDPQEIKKPDFLYTANVKLMQKINKVLNTENKGIRPETGCNYYRFYVGKGNNHTTVRQIIKRRSWWHREKIERFIQDDCENGQTTAQDEEDVSTTQGAHFVWTAWRK